MVQMNPAVGLLHTTYHRLVPYSIRIKLWSMRQASAGGTVVTRMSSSQERTVSPEYLAIQILGGLAVNQSQFAKAIIARHSVPGPAHTMMKTWLEYALTTNARGEAAVREIQQRSTVEGSRTLDIGCAYGGMPIAFAIEGADAYGVEIDADLLELARLNLADHRGVSCTLLAGDILQPGFAESLGQFDIITCDHVIEHVDKASVLVATLSRLLNPEGVCLLGIPNPFSCSEVVRDGHYGLFGLTLLERDRAIAYYSAAGNTNAYAVGEYCFSFDEYVQMFSDAGLTLEAMNPAMYSPEAVEALAIEKADIRRIFEEQVADHRIPPALADELRAAVEVYLARFDARYAEYWNTGDATSKQLLGTRLLIDNQAHWQVLAFHQHKTA